MQIPRYVKAVTAQAALLFKQVAAQMLKDIVRLNLSRSAGRIRSRNTYTGTSSPAHVLSED